MTPEELAQAREHAQAALAYRPIHLKPATENEIMFARAVVALTEQLPSNLLAAAFNPPPRLVAQQPEPVSRMELIETIADGHWPHASHGDAADALLSQYTITRKPQGGA